MDFLGLCKKLVSIESTPSTGNAEVAIYCASLCREAGLEVTLQEASLRDKPQYNVLARPKNQKPNASEVIFQTHLDTVEPGPLGSWTKTDSNPFSATVEGERIYGLGTADVKLDFLCKLEALAQFKNQEMTNPFLLVGTFGEEIGMHGAHYLMKSGVTQAKTAIIGEPSELQVVYANNGFMVINFEIPFTAEEKKYRTDESSTSQEKIFRGKAAHSSTPHLGDNAILKLVNYVEKMPLGIAILSVSGGSSINTVPADADVEVDAGKVFERSVGIKLVALTKELQRLEREFLNYEDKQFSPATPTLNLGLLKTTDEGVTLSVSFRLTPNISSTKVEEWVKHLEGFAEKAGCQCLRERISPAALTNPHSDLVVGATEINQRLGLKATPITKASGTECSVYNQYGLDCIVYGPGVSIGNSHTANEYNLLSQLEKAKEFYAEAVKRFCI